MKINSLWDSQVPFQQTSMGAREKEDRHVKSIRQSYHFYYSTLP